MREQAKDREALFNGWASEYDRHVSSDEGFPFGGYEHVIDAIVRQTCATPTSRILDLGTGTGNLAARLVGEKREIWGTDFSERMLEHARDKCPSIRFVMHDLLGSWPSELPTRFNQIVSAYVFHEFPFETKIRILIDLATKHLAPGDRITIGDIAFASTQERSDAHKRWKALWDEDEAYWAFDEIRDALAGTGLTSSFEQVSPCAGVFLLQQASSDETQPRAPE